MALNKVNIALTGSIYVPCPGKDYHIGLLCGPGINCYGRLKIDNLSTLRFSLIKIHIFIFQENSTQTISAWSQRFN
jgi:hypothetical protein